MIADRCTFGGTFTTQPMMEGRGPARGYPHPRNGGYLLVLQFQALAEWDQHLAQGRRVDGLGHPARLETKAVASLYVLDVERHAVVMFLSPQSDNAVTALLRVAAHVYGDVARGRSQRRCCLSCRRSRPVSVQSAFAVDSPDALAVGVLRVHWRISAARDRPGRSRASGVHPGRSRDPALPGVGAERRCARVGRASAPTDACLDVSIACGGEFLRRRVEAGEAAFIEMWESMGGKERFDRRRRWWAEARVDFDEALR